MFQRLENITKQTAHIVLVLFTKTILNWENKHERVKQKHDFEICLRIYLLKDKRNSCVKTPQDFYNCLSKWNGKTKNIPMKHLFGLLNKQAIEFTA